MTTIKTHLTYGLIIVALILLALFQYQGARTEKFKLLAEKAAVDARVNVLEDSLALRGVEIGHIQEKMARDSSKHVSDTTALRGALKQARMASAKLRVIAQPIIDENPEIADLISSQDEVVDTQEELINTNELYCQEQIRDMQAIIDLKSGQVVDALGMAEVQKQRGDRLEKRLKRKSGWTRFWKGAAAVLGAVVIVELVTK